MKMAIVYNSCNCPATTFMMNSPPVDMTVKAVSGAPVSQALLYQDNYIENIYGQDCGKYSIRFEPPLSILQVA